MQLRRFVLLFPLIIFFCECVWCGSGVGLFFLSAAVSCDACMIKSTRVGLNCTVITYLKKFALFPEKLLTEH
jgi:hypothetical protein